MRKWTVCLLVLAVLMLAATAVGEEQQREVITSGDWQYVVLDGGTAEIVKYTGEADTLTIPDTLDGKNVTSIGDGAFFLRDKLKSITLPDSITNIGENPFVECEKLSSIHVPPDHNYLAVIDGVLFSKPDKRLVCYPQGKTSTVYEIPRGISVIGDNAFYFCKSLRSIALPDSITSIGRLAFVSCSSLTSITLPDSVMRVEANPFLGCEELSSIHVSSDHNYLAVIDGVLFSKPDKRLVCYPQSKTNTTYEVPRGISIIGDNAFVFCRNLTSVTLPDSVTSIGRYDFELCSSLTSITLPESVTSIGYRAFARCDNLTITVPRNSYAAQYCKENKLNYTYPDANDWLTAP